MQASQKVYVIDQQQYTLDRRFHLKMQLLPTKYPHMESLVLFFLFLFFRERVKGIPAIMLQHLAFLLNYP